MTVPNEEAQNIVRIENLPSKVVQTEPSKRKEKNVNKTLVTVTLPNRQANKRKLLLFELELFKGCKTEDASFYYSKGS